MRWLCLLAVLLSGAGPAAAATFRSGDRVVVPRGEVVEDDLYAFGQDVLIEGEVRGDVVASGGEVRIPGHVYGDLISAAGRVRLDGQVDGSIRTMSGNLRLAGTVGKDAVIAGGELDLERQATVAGDLAAAAGTLRLLGSVGRDVHASAGQLRLDGAVGGAVRANTQQFVLGENAAVEGPLDYSATEEARIPPGARVGSAHFRPIARPSMAPAWFFLGWLRLSIGLFALGLIWRLVAPKLSREAPATLRIRPWSSLGTGALALLVAPIAGGLLFGLGLLLGGWWLAALLFAALLIAASLAFPTVGLFVGEALVGRLRLSRARLVATLGLGVVLLAFVVRVPLLGALAVLAALLFGLGALLLTGWTLRKAPAPS